MKASNLKEMSTEELEMKLEEIQRHLFDLRSQAVTEKLENTNSVANTKHDIARIKTIIRQRQLEEK